MADRGPSKPAVLLAGRPLIGWPLRALGAVCPRVAVVCKLDTHLPSLPDGVLRWNEPDEPRHPLTGILFALERAQADVLVCAADMPFIDTGALRTLVAGAGAASGALAVVAESDGRLEPALAVYRQGALRRLGEAARDAPLTRTVEGLQPARVSLAAEVVRSVNTLAELAAAERILSDAAAGR